MHPFRRTLGALLALGLAAALLAACGSDDDDAGATTEPAEADAATADAGDDAFPVTIEHKYGSTTIEARPERVVTVGYADQDSLLALDVIPVGIRDWYGDQPHAVWPWAQEALGSAEPRVLGSSELEYEAIMALRPDLIVGTTSGMTEEEYQLLADIAPTITQSGDFVDYGMPWQEIHQTIGQAVGEAELAERQVADLEARFAEIRDAHPEWQGKEALVAYTFGGNLGAYASADGRSRVLDALGFQVPEDIDELAGDLFYTEFSTEEMARLDRDLIVWVGAEDGYEAEVRALPLHASLDAVQEGREIFWTVEHAAAASFSSPLSLPHLLDQLVPQLEAALDGDPATEVPTS